MVSVSATLAANEALAERKRQGKTVVPMAFGQANLPVHPLLLTALSAAAGHGEYGPVAGIADLRRSVAGYWERRGLPTGTEQIIVGPGSKPLIYSLMMAIGGDIVLPNPSWVSYAVQAKLVGVQPIQVPTLNGQGGVPDPDLMRLAVKDARTNGRTVKSVLVTLPDNPTGTLASNETIQTLCDMARELDLFIISDEIYRDLVYDPLAELITPAILAPERTIVTGGLSKNLALGGWRMGVARVPDNEFGKQLMTHLKGIASEIWSTTPLPIQYAAAVAYDEPPELLERINASKSVHSRVVQAVTDRFRGAGATVAQPQGGFYLYPDLEKWRGYLNEAHSIDTAPDLAQLLLHEYGLGILPGSNFGDSPVALRFRVAPSLLYGDTDEQRQAVLDAADPLDMPWIAESLDQLEKILAAFEDK